MENDILIIMARAWLEKYIKIFYRDTSGQRQCSNTVTKLWFCPLIVNYWTELKNCIDKVLKTKLSLSFETFYLGKFHENHKKKLNIKLRMM